MEAIRINKLVEKLATALACKQLNRDYLMIDILDEHKLMAEERLASVEAIYRREKLNTFRDFDRGGES